MLKRNFTLLVVFLAGAGYGSQRSFDFTKDVLPLLNQETEVLAKSSLGLPASANISGSIPASLSDVAPNLREMHLSSNELTGSIPCELGKLTSMVKLYLDTNKLNGSIPSELGNLKDLQELHLEFNNLVGSIPRELGKMSAMAVLWMSYNRLTGSIPLELGNLNAMQYLSLAVNKLTGSIPREFGNLVGMQELLLDNNQLNGSIPRELGNLAAMENMVLAGNKLAGSIPRELGHLTALLFLVLNKNQLTGTIPVELGNLAALIILNLSENQLNGFIPHELGNLGIEDMDLSFNQLSGSIPSELGNLAFLWVLTLDHNQLNGSIPLELGNIKDLWRLSMAFNHLTGSIPPQLGKLTYLDILSLSNNSLISSIPSDLGGLTAVQYCNFEHNHLTGSIPRELGKAVNMKQLLLTDNHLTRSIPHELGNLKAIEQLNLAYNNLNGSIPSELGNLARLELFILSYNQITGSLPIELANNLNLRLFELSYNQITGSIPIELASNLNLISLRLSNNQLTGSVPSELGSLLNIELIDLSNNRLNGSIPYEFSYLTTMGSLELQDNHLTGSIPMEFKNLPMLEILDLSNNDLTGKIPPEWQILNSLNLSNNRLKWTKAGVLPEFALKGFCGAHPHIERFKWDMLRSLDVSGNPLKIQVQDFLWSIGYLHDLLHVFAQNTGVFGTLGQIKDLAHTGDFMCREAAIEKEAFSNLVTLQLADNNIRVIVTAPPPMISHADFSNNDLRALDHKWYFDSPTLANLKISNNSNLHVPIFLPSEGFCPVVGRRQLMANPLAYSEFIGNGSQVGVECTSLCVGNPTRYKNDLMLNKSVLCRCQAGWKGRGDNCTECPKNTFSKLHADGLTRTCVKCPLYSTTSTARAGQCEQCVCEEGYYLGDACSVASSPVDLSSSCKYCEVWSKPNALGTGCSPDPAAVIRSAIYVVSVAFLVFLRIVSSGRVLRVVDVSQRDDKTILTTLKSHRLYCPSFRKTFPITLKDTCHPGLDWNKDRPPRVCRAKVSSINGLELLDAEGNSIRCKPDDRLDTSKGTLTLTILDSLLHVAWPVAPIPVTLASVIILIVCIALALFALDPIEVGYLTPAVLFVAGVASFFVKWRTFYSWSPLQKALHHFDLWLAETNPKPKTVPKGPGRAMRLDKLLETHNFFRSFIQDRNAYYLDGNILKPLTDKYKMSYAEVVGPEQANFFVSHFWGTSFTHFCNSLEKHAYSINGPSVLERDVTPANITQFVSYWICFCSNNQYDIANELGGEAGWQESSFYLSLQCESTKSMIMVLDSKAMPLKRSWCIFETLQALKLKKKRAGFLLIMATDSGVLNHGNASVEAAMGVVNGVATMNLQDAQASDQKDKDMIDALVLEEMGSYKAMNDFVRGEIHEVLVSAQEQCTKEFKRLFDLMDEVRRKPAAEPSLANEASPPSQDEAESRPAGTSLSNPNEASSPSENVASSTLIAPSENVVNSALIGRPERMSL